jgi:hypothetical protein
MAPVTAKSHVAHVFAKRGVPVRAQIPLPFGGCLPEESSVPSEVSPKVSVIKPQHRGRS